MLQCCNIIKVFVFINKDFMEILYLTDEIALFLFLSARYVLYPSITRLATFSFSHKITVFTSIQPLKII